MRGLMVFVLCVACCGCASDRYELVTANRLHQLVDESKRDGVASWLYFGTDDSYHYFERTYPSGLSTFVVPPLFPPQCLFKVKKTEMTMLDSFPPAHGVDDPNSKFDPDPKQVRVVFQRWEKHALANGEVTYERVFDFNVRGQRDDPAGLN